MTHVMGYCPVVTAVTGILFLRRRGNEYPMGQHLRLATFLSLAFLLHLIGSTNIRLTMPIDLAAFLPVPLGCATGQ